MTSPLVPPPRSRRRLSQTVGRSPQLANVEVPVKEAGFSSETAGSGGSLLVDRQISVGGLSLVYSCATQAGNDPGGMQKDNQDSCVVKERLGGQDVIFFGVFDGHGYDGGKVSQAVVRSLPELIQNSESYKKGDFPEAFRQTFPEANEEVKAMQHIDTMLSGSTGITALVHGDGEMMIGNLGDSRCVIGGVDSKGETYAKALSTDHKPTIPEEGERILSCNGRTCPYICDGEPIGPVRVWLMEEDMPGLCMSRSFGDEVAASVGVIDEPEITSHKCTPTDKYVLLMSDGIFEFIEDDELIQIVNQFAKAGNTPREVGRKLVREARRRWNIEEDDVVDDCTVIVAYLSMDAR